jgi:hypothetical protein
MTGPLRKQSRGWRCRLAKHGFYDDGPVDKGVIAVRPTLQTEIKLFGRHKGGAIRDGVILSVLRPK